MSNNMQDFLQNMVIFNTLSTMCDTAERLGCTECERVTATDQSNECIMFDHITFDGGYNIGVYFSYEVYGNNISNVMKLVSSVTEKIDTFTKSFTFSN